MIGVSIAALSLLVNISTSPVARNAASASAVSTRTAAALPALKMPHFPMPKWRPHLPKRSTGADPLQETARRLTTLVRDQEKWYAEHASYSSNATRVAGASTRADSSLDKVQVQVLYASKKGWTAIASHPDAPGKSCVVYVGYRNALPIVPRTRADAIDADREGQPSCDR